MTQRDLYSNVKRPSGLVSPINGNNNCYYYCSSRYPMQIRESRPRKCWTNCVNANLVGPRSRNGVVSMLFNTTGLGRLLSNNSFSFKKIVFQNFVLYPMYCECISYDSNRKYDLHYAKLNFM